MGLRLLTEYHLERITWDRNEGGIEGLYNGYVINRSLFEVMDSHFLRESVCRCNLSEGWMEVRKGRAVERRPFSGKLFVKSRVGSVIVKL